MNLKATTVTEYLKTVPANRLDVFLELRDICLQTLDGLFKEGMQYGMPSYSFQNDVKVAWGDQKRHIAFCILVPEILEKFREELKKYDVGKSCIRFKDPAELDFVLIKKILQEVLRYHSS